MEGDNIIYCISGLGADEKAFAKLRIDGYRLQIIPWLPFMAGEALGSYAKRMSASIEGAAPVLMGLSFGGIVCCEIAKQRPVKTLILISTVKTKTELPLWLRAVGWLSLHKIFPMRSSRFTAPVQNHVLGVTNAEEKIMATNYRKHADPAYTRWAIDHIVNWKNDILHPQVIHIHGSNDRIFPLKYVKPDLVVTGGGHLMIMNKAGEISIYINRFLAGLRVNNT